MTEEAGHEDELFNDGQQVGEGSAGFETSFEGRVAESPKEQGADAESGGEIFSEDRVSESLEEQVADVASGDRLVASEQGADAESGGEIFSEDRVSESLEEQDADVASGDRLVASECFQPRVRDVKINANSSALYHPHAHCFSPSPPSESFSCVGSSVGGLRAPGWAVGRCLHVCRLVGVVQDVGCAETGHCA